MSQTKDAPASALGVLVKAEGLVKVYRRGAEEIRALDGVNVRVQQGEFVCLLGHSGAGKTTTLNLFGLMDRPSDGELTVAGHAISGADVSFLPEAKLDMIRRENIGFIFQQFYLMPTLSATENVDMPLLWSGKSDVERSRALLERVGLGHRMTHRPAELSGGEQQRVAVARALINEPKLLLADEPTGNLDTRTRDAIFDLFGELNKEGLAIVLATHDTEIARRVDTVIHLQEGRIVD
ncbi:MAG: ABC transporter ATP-binding protein [Armatimonadetes bacterium]|nr:ABC transporter ATP-binding protein [Armatimonadota bacterium]